MKNKKITLELKSLKEYIFAIKRNFDILSLFWYHYYKIKRFRLLSNLFHYTELNLWNWFDSIFSTYNPKNREKCSFDKYINLNKEISKESKEKVEKMLNKYKKTIFKIRNSCMHLYSKDALLKKVNKFKNLEWSRDDINNIIKTAEEAYLILEKDYFKESKEYVPTNFEVPNNSDLNNEFSSFIMFFNFGFK